MTGWAARRVDRRREAVAATRYARHVLGPVRVLGERLPELPDLEAEVALLDLRPGPGRRRQLAVADHLAGP